MMFNTEEEKQKFLKDFKTQFMAGAISGALVQAIIHPLDKNITQGMVGAGGVAAEANWKSISKKVGKGALASAIGYPVFMAVAKKLNDEDEHPILDDPAKLEKQAWVSTVVKGLKSFGGMLRTGHGIGTFKGGKMVAPGLKESVIAMPAMMGLHAAIKAPAPKNILGENITNNILKTTI